MPTSTHGRRLCLSNFQCASNNANAKERLTMIAPKDDA